MRNPEPTGDRVRVGIGAATLAVIGWGFGGVLVKLISMQGMALSFYRLWLGLCVMLTTLLLARRRLTFRILRQSAAGGAFYGVQVALFFSALKLTSIADVLLISALQPALVLLVASRWFGEAVGPWKIGCTLVSVCGVALVVLGSAGTPAWSPVGDILAVGALFTWTGYWLVSKRVRSHSSTIEYMTGVMLVSAVLVTPVALLSGQSLNAGRTADWLWLGILVVGPGTSCHLLMGWAHRYIDVTVSSLLVLGVPVLAVVGALVFLKEPLGVLQLMGMIIAASGIVAMLVYALRRGTREEAIDWIQSP